MVVYFWFFTESWEFEVNAVLMPDNMFCLPFWEGFTVTRFQQQSNTLLLELEPAPDTPPRWRVRCPQCGPKMEQLSWLGRYARLTRRLAETVAHGCSQLPIRHVAELFGLHWDTVRQLDRRRPELQLAGLPEAETRRMLWVGEGRSREAIRPFFSGLRKRALRPDRSRRHGHEHGV
ncbi:transposase family protein [Chromobacterium violaceum]|nr:transposase family protein [Chromobacterium violaceum]